MTKTPETIRIIAPTERFFELLKGDDPQGSDNEWQPPIFERYGVTLHIHLPSKVVGDNNRILINATNSQDKILKLVRLALSKHGAPRINIELEDKHEGSLSLVVDRRRLLQWEPFSDMVTIDVAVPSEK